MKTFIEIGAADFDTMINADNWRGIICEPHPVFYERLKKKCENPNITILETAISDRHGEGVMYFPTEEYIDMTEGDELTEWTRGAGGFRIPGFNHKLAGVLTQLNV